jgi:hypothetical protein
LDTLFFVNVLYFPLDSLIIFVKVSHPFPIKLEVLCITS